MESYIIRLNWVDIIVLILVIRSTYMGFTHGFGYEFLTFLGIFGSTLLAIHNYKYIGRFLVDRINLPIDFSYFISFLILAIGTYLLCRYARMGFY